MSPKGDVACAIANAGEVTVGGWSFDPKFGTVGKHPKNSFFEGGVNLNEVFEDVPCFTGFLAETRSSPSVDATLKDYALGEFELCSATGIKDCDQMVQNSTFDGFEATLSGSVTNTGVGPLWQAIVRCDNGTTDPADDFDISVANKIEPDGIPVLWGPLTEPSDVPFGTYGGTVFAATFDGGPLVDFGATESPARSPSTARSFAARASPRSSASSATSSRRDPARV